MDENLIGQLRTEAAHLGFTTMGIVTAVPARRLDAYFSWVAHEMHGTMGYMARADRLLRRQNLDVILPGVRTIICVGLPYYTLRLPEVVAHDPSRGRISNYAWGADYHDIMTPRLQKLAAWLADQARNEVKHRVYVDTGAILERDHAETAALGFTGKNTMLINARRGSWFFLGEILTTLEIKGQEQHTNTALHSPVPNSRQKPSCGTCQRCLNTCPTQAFPEPYVLDARRCISYLTIELKGWIPRELRPLLGNWIYGCDVCQEVCPFNRFAQPTIEKDFYPPAWRLETRGQKPQADNGPNHQPPNWDSVAPPLLTILSLDEARFQEQFAHSPIQRIKRERLVRNACVAAGNWGSETAVPPLTHLLTDPIPLIRGHAAWALQQIGTKTAKTAVAAALQRETDTRVRLEMTASST